jgi:hypothetical protein
MVVENITKRINKDNKDNKDNKNNNKKKKIKMLMKTNKLKIRKINSLYNKKTTQKYSYSINISHSLPSFTIVLNKMWRVYLSLICLD